MRIGHFAPTIWSNGGIATYIRRLGAAQTVRGHDVWYLDRQPRPSPNDAPPAAPCHARHIILHDDANLVEWAQTLRLDVLHLHKAPDVSARDLAAGPVACVRTLHGHQASCPSATRFLSRHNTACNRTPNVPTCLWGHFADGCGSRRPGRLVEAFRRFRHEQRLAARIPTMPVSAFLRASMIQAGCPPASLHVVPSPAPAVATATPLPVERPPRVLFLGRIVPQKGVAWLLRALAQSIPSVHLDVAGDGRALEDARALADRLGLAGRVTFHGWVDPGAVVHLIRQSWGVVVPSLWHEPAGLVTLEAAAHGRPVIASSVGGIPEYAHPDFSLLVPPNDTAALADALTALATAPDRAVQMGRSARAHAQTTFALRPFLDRVEAVYREAIQDADARNATRHDAANRDAANRDAARRDDPQRDATRERPADRWQPNAEAPAPPASHAS